MTFNDNARLDTSQVSSGGGGGLGRGMAVGGGGGIIMLLVLLFQLFFGGSGSGGQGGSGPWSFSDGSIRTAGDGAAAGQGGQWGADGQAAAPTGDFSHCQTGADANKYDDCRVIGTVNSVNAYWSTALAEATGGRRDYTPAKTVIYSGATQSQCGTASNQVGPFYCPLDRQIYIDTSFFNELSSKFGANGGPFAKMYVVAHEYGHAVEDQLGVLGYAQQDPKGAQSGAVRIELMADCFAGVWAHHAVNTKDAGGQALFEPFTQKDIEDGLSAAAAVGDDHIQKMTRGRVTPESWTHGSSEQRMRWFMTGYESGQPARCDVLNTREI